MEPTQIEKVQEALERMEVKLKEAQNHLATISTYVVERIRVDNLKDGFQKGYDQEMIQGRNSETLLALGKLQAIIN